ncbi:hypothetical protein R1flu_002431 [Riccia fluitans]|uniref:Uncharacterized protein n=1 Tax=Riccia fluitans TaxID=41844 RepID=A0ABD1Y672_9MARC
MWELSHGNDFVGGPLRTIIPKKIFPILCLPSCSPLDGACRKRRGSRRGELAKTWKLDTSLVKIGSSRPWQLRSQTLPLVYWYVLAAALVTETSPWTVT